MPHTKRTSKQNDEEYARNYKRYVRTGTTGNKNEDKYLASKGARKEFTDVKFSGGPRLGEGVKFAGGNTKASDSYKAIVSGGKGVLKQATTMGGMVNKFVSKVTNPKPPTVYGSFDETQKGPNKELSKAVKGMTKKRKGS